MVLGECRSPLLYPPHRGSLRKAVPKKEKVENNVGKNAGTQCVRVRETWTSACRQQITNTATNHVWQVQQHQQLGVAAGLCSRPAARQTLRALHGGTALAVL